MKVFSISLLVLVFLTFLSNSICDEESDFLIAAIKHFFNNPKVMNYLVKESSEAPAPVPTYPTPKPAPTEPVPSKPAPKPVSHSPKTPSKVWGSQSNIGYPSYNPTPTPAPKPITKPAPAPTPAPTPTPVLQKSTSGFKYRGVNQAGADFAGTNLPGKYGTDYEYPEPNGSTAYFVKLGMNYMRMPYLLERLVPDAVNFNEAEWTRFKASVAGIKAAGATVLLDAHNYFKFYN